MSPFGRPGGAHALSAAMASLAAGAAASGSRGWLVGQLVEEGGHRAHLRVVESSVFIAARKASPPGSARTAQPMCLRAVRTPMGSPYSA